MQSKKLWFTEYDCLNDDTEGNLVYQAIDYVIQNEFYDSFGKAVSKWILLKDISGDISSVEELKLLDEMNPFIDRLNDKYFICCFSEDSDNLSLWNYYTKTPNSVGYNISFDADKILSSFKENNQTGKINIIMHKVIYDFGEQFDIVYKILNKGHELWKEYTEVKEREYIIMAMSAFFDFFRFVFKHPAFSFEKEVRMVVRMTQHEFDENILFDSNNNSDGFIKLRTINSVFSPYIALSYNDNNLIEKISISPTLKNEQAKLSTFLLLQKYNLKNCGVYLSSIPLKY